MDQIPRMADLLAASVDALLGDLTGGRRDARERYAQSGPTGGRFGDVIRGWRGQAEVIRARLTKEVMATRLDRCGGQELKDLARSEYFAELPSDPQFAVGEVAIVREVTNATSSATGNFSAGVLPAGLKISKAADPAYVLGPTQSAEYVTLGEVVCGTDDNSPVESLGGGQWTHRQGFSVPVRATRTGPHANVPIFNVGQLATLQSPSALFDRTFRAGAINAAGGTLGIVDDQIRAIARAMATGLNGPTQGAAVAGSLTNAGVRRVVYSDDATNGLGSLFVADESWASSQQYRDALARALRARPWIGWGCRVAVQKIENIDTVVGCTVILRDSNVAQNQTEITANIRTALTEYFDDRPDFYTWTLNAIGAVIGGADSRILACTAVSVSNTSGDLFGSVDSFGTITGAEPPPVLTPFLDRIDHFMLLGVTPTYQLPGA